MGLWILGGCAVLIWLVALVGFFHTDVLRAWRGRHDHWFRGD